MTDVIEYKYFLGCASVDGVKSKYKELAKKLHPDLGGSHTAFVTMKEEYDNILIYAGYPIANRESVISAFKKVWKETAKEEKVTNLNPQEIEVQRAKVYFDNLRVTDPMLDIVDGILNRMSGQRHRHHWAFQECSRLDNLELVHFKYFTFKLGIIGVSKAHELYKHYLANK